MTPDSPTTRYFGAAVQQLLLRTGRGAQSDLARRAHISPSYLSDLLSGRKTFWPDNIKDRIAGIFGYTVSEMLDIGEHFLTYGVFWPHGRKVIDTAAKSPERMARIYQLAARDLKFKSEQILFSANTAPVMFPQVASEYFSGSIPDAQLYHIALSFCRSICPEMPPPPLISK